MSVQVHVPVSGLDWQVWLVGQTPPHAGAGLCEQGSGMSWQPQMVVPGICLQAWLVGQTPPHCGA
jgi:hypothetical protein